MKGAFPPAGAQYAEPRGTGGARPEGGDFAQDVMDSELARVNPDEMAQLLARLREAPVA